MCLHLPLDDGMRSFVPEGLVVDIDVVVPFHSCQEFRQHLRKLPFRLAPEIITWMFRGNGLEALALVHPRREPWISSR